jgi:uncharacterized radical SAM superfamily Fe-S cluster-containing enzyme
MMNNEYYLWGAGEFGKRIIEFMNFMKDSLRFKAVIDNDPAKQGTMLHGIPVISYGEAKKDLPNVKVVISFNYPTKIREFLLNEGFVEFSDFFTMHSFIPIYFWQRKKLVAKTIDIGITTICNMKCECCQVCMPYAVDPRHVSAESIIREMDLVFAHFDATIAINLGVGESLLNKELPDIVILAVFYVVQTAHWQEGQQLEARDSSLHRQL